ncbi:hypothetical protein BV25DRAFT_1832154 [Artomyces pyxidatus]|uniref:Uncharacterized protein n=1 Tax=Artomyces pyxidatus TaxID=48021 RepID=A0ACB8SJQ1_9AGAM|nr:hypothetical protein BV25DRAFT_1832154 [Artomyces pyxidatus]
MQNFGSTYGADSRRYPPPTHEHFVSFLQQTVCLETLILQYCLPCPSHNRSKSTNIIKLPRLNYLGLSGAALDVIGVLELIALSPDICFALSCGCNDDSGEELLSAVFFFNGGFFAESPYRISLRSLSLFEVVGTLSLGVDILSPSPATEDGAPDFDPDQTKFVLHLYWINRRSKDIVPVVQRVCRTLPLQDLDTLQVKFPTAEWTKQDWVDAFNRAPAVKHLRVGAAEKCFLAEALLHRVRELDSAEARPSQRPAITSDYVGESFLFPVLESLTLRKTDLMRTYREHPPRSFYDDLFACLEERGDRKAGLRQLYLAPSVRVGVRERLSYNGVVGSVIVIPDSEDDDEG